MDKEQLQASFATKIEKKLNMFFDAVFNHKDQPVFNGTPTETREFLLGRSLEENASSYVCRGETLEYYTVWQYLEG